MYQMELSSVAVVRLGLFRGTPSVVSSVMSWMAYSFDCSFRSLSFPSYELVTFANNCMTLLQQKYLASKPLQLTYQLPFNTGIDTVMLTFPMVAIYNLLDKNKQSIHQVPNKDTVLFEAINAEFKHYFCISLEAMQLVKVGTPVAYISNEGQLKLFSNVWEVLELKPLTE